MALNAIRCVPRVSSERTVRKSVHRAKTDITVAESMASVHTAIPAGSEIAVKYAVLMAPMAKTVRRIAAIVLMETVTSPQESVCVTLDFMGHTAT